MNNQEKYKFGIEYEIIVPYEGYDDFMRIIHLDHNDNSLFQVGTDGSLRNDGLGISHEARGIKAFTWDELVRAANDMDAASEKAKIIINSSCGLHLHVSHPDFFNAANIRKIVMTWVAIEDVLVATQPASRMNNGYCMRFLAQYLDQNYSSQFRFMKAKDSLIRQLRGMYRRNALNLSSMSKHGSIEIRLHAGTTDAEKVINWARLMKALFDYSFTNYNSKNIKALFRTEISEAKIDQAFTELRLPDDLSTFYKTRIEKHLFTSLKKHTIAAVSNMDMLLKIRKQQRIVKGHMNTMNKEGTLTKEGKYTEVRLAYEKECVKLNNITDEWSKNKSIITSNYVEQERDSNGQFIPRTILSRPLSAYERASLADVNVNAEGRPV